MSSTRIIINIAVAVAAVALGYPLAAAGWLIGFCIWLLIRGKRS